MSKGKKTRKRLTAAAPPSDKAPPRRILSLLALGLAIRLVYLVMSRKSPYYEPLLLDPAYYHQWALRIAHGHWDKGVFYGLPLYPYFLAIIYKVSGESLLAVKLIQIFLGLVTLFVVYKIGEKIASPAVGLAAGLIAACYGPLFFHEALFIPEALSVPLYALSFYAVCLFTDRPTVPKAAALGVLFGLAALTKAGILLFIILFLTSELLKEMRGEKRWVPVAVVGAAFLLTLAPVTAHNLIQGQDRVLLTSHGGFNFYIGNNPKAEGVFMAPEGTGSNVEAQIEDSRAVAERETGRSLKKPSEVSRYWSAKAMEFIKARPLKFLGLTLRKLLLFFDSREFSDVDDYVFGGNFNPFLKFPWLDFTVLGPLVFAGVCISLRDVKYRFYIALWVFSYLAGMAAFFINARYRLPLLGLFFPLAALALVDMYRCFKEKAWGRLLFYSLALSAGVIVGRLHLVESSYARDYVNTGDIYVEKNEPERAISFFEKALQIEPGSAHANQAMGTALSKLKRYDEAKNYYLKAIQADPNNSLAYNNLGLWYDRRGNLEEAERCFLSALQSKPNSAQAHNNLGMVYGKKGLAEKAIGEFQMSLKFNPSNARTYTNLGLVLYRAGRPAEAADCWKKALEIDPDFEDAKLALSAVSR